MTWKWFVCMIFNHRSAEVGWPAGNYCERCRSYLPENWDGKR